MKNTWIVGFVMACSLQPLFAQHEIFIQNGVAIQGYDPVAYFKVGKPVKGTDDLKMNWKSATWKFSNNENLEAFKADPEKYAPQFGGYCAYGMSEGHKAPTQPEAWTIVDDKLYLNYNTDVKKIWTEKRSERIDLANKNWPSVKLQKD